MEPSPGTRIGSYTIEKLLGRGGMGNVYLARQARPDRLVAIKLISPELADDPVFRARFERESELAARIEHPNVIPVYDVSEHDGRLYIAMRYVEGSDLKALLAGEGALDPRRAVRIVAQIGNALDAAHARGLVHRDVKPANVLVAQSAEGEHVYLTDFGLTKETASSGVTATGMFLGTIDYAAPEQISGGPTDARTDVYALGCVLFHVLTGEVPFPRESEVAKIYAHLNDSVPSVSALAPELPIEFDEVVRKATNKEPERRYLSAGDLGRAAATAVAGGRYLVTARSVARGRAAPSAATLSSRQTPGPTDGPPPALPVHAGGQGTQTARPQPTGPSAVAPLGGGRRKGPALVVASALVAAAVIAAVLAAVGHHSASARIDQAAAQVARGWAIANNSGNDEAAGSYFAVGAVAGASRLNTHADAVRFSSEYGCAGRIRSVQAQRRQVLITFSGLYSRPGHRCPRRFLGTTRVVGVTVTRGKIVRWKRV